MNKPISQGRRWWLISVAVFLTFLATYFCLLPGLRVTYELLHLSSNPDAPPRFAMRMHKQLAPKYERWARERVASGDAGKLTVDDLVETEWPIFGTVFFLWATESLQEAWEEHPTLSKKPPTEYAAGAIDAATELVLDPNHGKWVKDHWGEHYLHHENVFYRMLLIGAITARYNLVGCDAHFDVLRDQVETLADDIDASRAGLLEDYPNECYPGDVLAGIACIKRADKLLGTDHSEILARAIRGFDGERLDDNGLVPFLADARFGLPITEARGSGNSYVSIMAPEVWPERAKEWYDLYEQHFWVDGRFISGFREYYPSIPDSEWAYDDMDAGPVIAGFGMAASAFGLGAARANGRFDHAYALEAQMIAASWPLPNGTLLVPRILSSATHAAYLGEACIVYNMTRQPVDGVPIVTGGRIPPLAYGITAIYFLIAALCIIPSASMLMKLRPWG